MNTCGDCLYAVELLDCYPESAAIETPQDGKLPNIHKSLPIIERMLNLYPLGIHTKDSNGMTVLHQVCNDAAVIVEVVRFVMEKDRSGAC